MLDSNDLSQIKDAIENKLEVATDDLVTKDYLRGQIESLLVEIRQLTDKLDNLPSQENLESRLNEIMEKLERFAEDQEERFEKLEPTTEDEETNPSI